MERFARRRTPVNAPGASTAPGASSSDVPPIREAPAIRDASAILARAKADEAAADQAREAFRTHPMPTLEPDDGIAPLLGPDEWVVAVRRSVQLDRRQSIPGWAAPGVAGDLYVTSRRLALVGRITLVFGLDDIDEACLSGERLLLALHDGQGISLDVEQPRLLRVEIAAARARPRLKGAPRPASS